MSFDRTATVRRPTVPYWAAAGATAGMVVIAWWASGVNGDAGDYYLTGPYRIPLPLEYVVGGAAVALGLAGLIASVRIGRATRGISRATTVLLVVTAMMAAGLWRVMTLGGMGANIGGGVAALVGPVLIAGGLFLALCAERKSGGISTRSFVVWSVLAWISAPILIALALRFL